MPKRRSSHRKNTRQKPRGGYTKHQLTATGTPVDPQAIGRAGQDQAATLGTSQPAGTKLIEGKRDQQLLTMLGQHDEWQMPQELFVQIPNDLKLMITERNEDGEYSHSASDRKWAMNQARMLTRDNWQRDKAAIHIQQRNEFMISRHTRAETPEPDEAPSSSIEAVAFREKVSREEMIDAATQLEQLGLLPLLLNKTENS